MTDLPAGQAHLCLDTSLHAQAVGFKRPTSSQLVAATTTTGRAPKKSAQAGVAGGKRHGDDQDINPTSLLPPASTYPGPLVLPGDDLAYDPKLPAQSVRAWLRLKDRNEVTSDRRTIYIVPAPTVDPIVAEVEQWTIPTSTSSIPTKGWAAIRPRAEDVTEYIRAFFTPLPVKVLPANLKFVPWSSSPPPKSASQPQYIGLECPTIDQLFGIRHRATPTSAGIFPRQLNLNDLLDANLELLPDDAYAILMLSHHDIYESEEDDFCCGRAFGGSRVAVVSEARYSPLMDEKVMSEREAAAAWPLSHCAEILQPLSGPKGAKQHLGSVVDAKTAIGAAIMAAKDSAPLTNGGDRLHKDLFALRVARTATHELGHCFGLEHCVYYACFMQGTGSMAEDVRQPPYACPVCSVKVLKASGATEADQFRALADICEPRVGSGWRGFVAWLRKRIQDSENA